METMPLNARALAEERDFDEFDVASQLAAERGWLLPAYTTWTSPPNTRFGGSARCASSCAT